VFAGIALMHEPAESDVMHAPPRDVRRSKLVDFQLISYAYLFMGNCQSIGAFVNWFSYMQTRGPTGTTPDPLPLDDDGNGGPFPAGYLPSQLTFAWNFGLDGGALGADEVAALNTASSVFYVTLIVSQLAHLLSIRRSGSPYFSDLRGFPSWSHWFAALPRYLVPPAPIMWAWIGALTTAILLTEVKAINEVTGTDHVPAQYWGAALGWAAAIFILAETRKWIVYLFPHWWIVRWGKGELNREPADKREQA
jgi:sodium/potassium-transporting ATPase subunit alpha